VASAFLAGDGRAQQIVVGGTSIDMPQLPGMARGPVKTGTGQIRGRVVSADTGAPVRRAQVRISGSEIASKSALSDVEGRYEFRDLPAGRFNLTAQKPGYMTVQYGQTRPFESGKAIDLADRQTMDKAEIAMPRGSVISGRIVDEFGDPIADAVVSAMRSVWSNGKRRLQQTGRTAQTNDLGQYRLFGLAPGEYYVSATLRGGDMAMVEMAMAATATVAGAATGPTGSSPNSGYAPTYFPGTTSGGDAQRVTLNVGQEAQGTDFALLPVRLAKITGTVINSDGKPAEGSVVNAIPKSAGTDVVFGPGSTGRTDKTGSFTISNVAPGDYTLQTRAVQIMTSGDGATMTFTMTRIVGPDGPSGGEPESGSLPVSVSGEDISNVVIITTKGASATGHLAYDGDMKPAGGSTVRIMAMPVDPGDGLVLAGGGAGTVKADGSFELKGLTGTRIFRALNLPPGWSIKSVKLNGQDVTDAGAEFKGSEAVTGLEILVTPKTTQVDGTVRDASGNTVKDYTVVLFSDDPQKWTVPTARYVSGVRPDTEGRFQVKGLPPGGYYAVAVDYIAQGEWGDPDLLDKLKDKATRVNLDEGESKTLELKIGR
jgi:protocatechuate 3,4-dioxygenase beta subunit